MGSSVASSATLASFSPLATPAMSARALRSLRQCHASALSSLLGTSRAGATGSGIQSSAANRSSSSNISGSSEKKNYAAVSANSSLLKSTFAGQRLLHARSGFPTSAAAFGKRFVVHNAVAAPAPVAREVRPEVAEALGFERVAGQFVSEYNSQATLYRHKKTGAEIMSLATDDENKVFGIVFRTPPTDSTGIPHILEHSVLCGSRKYPLKEPFVELIKGSLHTFLNAFTYPDRTCYPVASTNLQDFYNLVDVYLDAVFFPKCVNDEQTFQQEGWHYELEDAKDDITFKGVVFNEMKGVYSQPDSHLARITQQALFPDNTYSVDSGGDPREIPNLTFQQFQEFHGKFYHPSNARIWFYGDDDPELRLKKLAEYLDQFEANSSPKESEIAIQPLFSAPRTVTAPYPVGSDTDAAADDGSAAEKRHMAAVNWLLSDQPLSLEEELALGFLDHLLLGTPAAPLRKKLLESGLGEALIGGGLDDTLRQMVFSIGLKGVAKGDVGKVEALVIQTLEELAEEGFSDEAVEASINTIEFSLRENNTGSFPRGLSLMLRSVGKWLYGGDPFEPLQFESPLADFKQRLQAEGTKGVFSPLIRNRLLDNPHRVTIELQPDSSLTEQEESAEVQRLASVKQSLDGSGLERLVKTTKELKERQETPDPPEALKAVPSLSLEDIPKEPIRVPIQEQAISSPSSTILTHDIFTNDILYLDLALNLRPLPARLLPYVPLFCQSLLEMGTKDLSFVQLNQLIGRKTGGISLFPLTTSKRGSEEPISKLVVRGKGTSAQTEDLLELMRTVLMDVQLSDQQRFKQFVSQRKQGMESRMLGGGHSVAASRLDAMDNQAGWAGEQMGGLSYLEFLRKLEKEVDENWPAVQSSLEEIRSVVLSSEGAVVNLTGDEKTLTHAERPIRSLLSGLPAQGKAAGAAEWGLLEKRNEALIVPTKVNYVGKAANIYKAAGYELNGSAHVISKVIGMSWLWERVRVSGGAYGGFCDFDSHSGVFTFLSYRDPNLLKTLDNYDASVQFLRDLTLDDDALTKAIIGTISDIDSYQLPDAKGYSSMLRWLLGITDEERQIRREQILSTTVSDFHAFADALESVAKEGSVVVVASAADVEAANAERPGLLIPQTIL